MFTDQAIYILLFKTLTLVGVIGLMIYAYKYGLKKFLLQMLDDQRRSFEYLLKAKNELDEQQLIIDQRVYAQQECAEDLSKKIALWNSAIQQDKHTRIQESNARKERLLQEYAQRQDHAYLERVRAAMGLQVVKEIHAELKQKFNDPESGKAYIHDVVQVLKDRVL